MPISGYDSPCTGVEADALDERISSRMSFITYGLIEYSPFGYFPGPFSAFLTDPDSTSSVSRAEIVSESIPVASDRLVGDMLANSA